jgi:hypothetical protein
MRVDFLFFPAWRRALTRRSDGAHPELARMGGGEITVDHIRGPVASGLIRRGRAALAAVPDAG